MLVIGFTTLNNQNNPVEELTLSSVKIIGVAGGSCSGKTLLVKRISEVFGVDDAVVIEQDSYYFGLHGKSGRACKNFDHPDSIDFGMLRSHLEMLAKSCAIEVPVYDFKTHSRTSQTVPVKPKKLVFVEGTLILASPELSNAFDQTFYIECDEALRKHRRLARDVNFRGRTTDSVEAQFEEYVGPMHRQFVSPSKQHADHIIGQQECDNEIRGTSTMIVDYCRQHLKNTTQAIGSN